MKLVLTPGMGIGPEVSVRALAQLRDFEHDLAGGTVAIAGRWEALTAAGGARMLPLRRVRDLDEALAAGPGVVGVYEPPDAPEPLEVAAIRRAVDACLHGAADALVTGPIHKAKLAARGFGYPGHTEFLGDLCGIEHPVMAFVGGELRVALVTVHLPLAAVSAALTLEGIASTTRIAARALADNLGLSDPRIAVCGLNPHAGEDGLLGREELEVIGPACATLRDEGLAVTGPVSAETAFLLARRGETDLVVAMYHDQGLGPLKVLDFGRSVNWTLGLPFVRTSVDHGTADALVGTGRADPASMAAALRLAVQIVRRKHSLGQLAAR